MGPRRGPIRTDTIKHQVITETWPNIHGPRENSHSARAQVGAPSPTLHIYHQLWPKTMATSLRIFMARFTNTSLNNYSHTYQLTPLGDAVMRLSSRVLRSPTTVKQTLRDPIRTCVGPAGQRSSLESWFCTSQIRILISCNLWGAHPFFYIFLLLKTYRTFFPPLMSCHKYIYIYYSTKTDTVFYNLKI